MIFLTGKIPSAQSWQDLGETGTAKVLRAMELAPGICHLVLSGSQAAHSRDGFAV